MGVSVVEHRQCWRLPSRELLLVCTQGASSEHAQNPSGPRGVHRHPSATRPVLSVYSATRGAQDEAYPGVAGVEVVAGLVAHAGGDAPAGGVVNAAVDHLAVGGTLVNTLRETRNSSERVSLSDPERGHLLCPDLQSAQCRRLNIPPALPPPTAPTHLAAKEAELGHTQKSEHVAVCYSRSRCSGTGVRSSHISSVLEERVSKLEKFILFVFQARREEVVE